MLVPATFYLIVAVAAGMDIGARHILPVYVLMFVLAGTGFAVLAANGRNWKWLAAGAACRARCFRAVRLSELHGLRKRSLGRREEYAQPAKRCQRGLGTAVVSR